MDASGSVASVDTASTNCSGVPSAEAAERAVASEASSTASRTTAVGLEEPFWIRRLTYIPEQDRTGLRCASRVLPPSDFDLQLAGRSAGTRCIGKQLTMTRFFDLLLEVFSQPLPHDLVHPQRSP